MATTTNYGWDTPDDTDLVKDGAAAIRTLGSSIDTTTKNLNPETTLGDLAYRSATANVKTRLALGTAGQVLRVNSGGNAPEWATTADQTPLTTKGDVFTFSTVDARLGVGANGTVLTADSAEATGLKWATPAAAGGKTLLSTTSLTSTGVSISVNQGYKDLEIWVYKVSLTGQAGPSFKDNNLPGTYYSFLREGSASSAAGRTDVYLIGSGDLNTGADAGNFVIYVYNYTSSERKIFNWTGQLRAFSDNTDRSIFGGGYMDSSAALTDLSIFTTGGPTFDGGTVKVYGVN